MRPEKKIHNQTETLFYCPISLTLHHHHYHYDYHTKVANVPLYMCWCLLLFFCCCCYMYECLSVKVQKRQLHGLVKLLLVHFFDHMSFFFFASPLLYLLCFSEKWTRSAATAKKKSAI